MPPAAAATASDDAAGYMDDADVLPAEVSAAGLDDDFLLGV